MRGQHPFPRRIDPKAPPFRGPWVVRYQLDDLDQFKGRFVVEDEDGLVIAVVPYGVGEVSRLGYVMAEKVAKAIAAMAAGGAS